MEKNGKICQECYSHDNRKLLRSRLVTSVIEIQLFLSVTHLSVSGVLQMLLHVLPSQGMTFVPELVRGVQRD